MSKTIISGTSGQQVIHDSDGKNSTPIPSAGKPIVVVSSAGSGKTISVHGTKTQIVFDSPA